MTQNEEPITMDDIVERARISYLFWKHTRLIPGSLQSIREAMLKELERIFTREVLEADEKALISSHDESRNDKAFMPSDQWLREYVLRYWKSADDRLVEAFDFLKAADSYEDLQLRLRCFSYTGKWIISGSFLNNIYKFIMLGEETL